MTDNPFSQPHEYWMRFALREAEKAYELDEVPIGCVIVKENAIVGRGYNQTVQLKDSTAHAEMIAITAASGTLDSRFLIGCTMYVTLEPCPMCAGALVNSRVETLVFGSYDPKAGACGTLYTITEDERLNHRIHTIGGILDSECGGILKEYFRKKR
ncbi:MAG: tRNA adenosine(34) deaminase TadA [Bacteroidota bacterium]|nr:tRNA adenosine(34) deaminase TadA [Bacteroidota bacterium]MDP4229041.1 tRNA adenosine(34) deaminase TadA [Bacteroidota bacterium]MDP4235432.1 tRNA adenosine(34) deaminase TadA [Bacteroidota bacterium]